MDNGMREKFEYNKEHIFDAFSETADGYLFIGKLKTGEFMYSDRMVQDFALPGRVVENAAEFWGKLVHPEDKDLFLKSNQEVAEGKTDRHTIFYRARNAKGKWIRLICKGKMFCDSEGLPDIFAGVIHNLDDIEMSKNLSAFTQSSFYYTKEMTEKEQLNLGEALLNFLNLHIPGGIIATADDPELSIICFNQTLIEYMGYTHEEFLEKTGGKFREFIYEEDREKVLEEVRRQLEEKNVYEIYYRIIRNDGSIAWIYDVGKYKYNEEGRRRILSLLMDATDEIERGKELQFINANSTSGVFKGFMKERFEITYANDGFYKIFGYTKEQMKRELSNDIGKILEEKEKGEIERKVRSAIEEGKDKITLEYKIRKSDGSFGWIREDCDITKQKDGKIVMFGIVMDMTERHVLEEQLHYTEQIYKFIGNYTKLDVWEYDAGKNQLTIHDVKDGIYEVGKIYHNVPEELIAIKRIHPDSEKSFRKMYEDIRKGVEHIVLEVQFCEPDGSFIWKRITSLTIKDEDKNVKGAIGIAEDITVQKEAEIRAFEQEKMREILSRDTLYSVHINLVTNNLEAVWGEKEAVDIHRHHQVSYEEVYTRIYQSIANEDDRKRFEKELAPEKVKEYAGIENFSREFEFRQVDQQGQIIWVNLSARIITSPTTGNQILFLYARNIDMVKRRELSLQKKAEINEITGLYNLTTTKLLIENILKNTNKNAGESALILINIDNFREINSTGGFAMGDDLLRQVSTVMMKKMSSTSVIGHVNGDLFLVYLHGRKTRKALRKEAKEFIDALCREYICGKRKFEVTVSAGAVYSETGKMTYDLLYQRAYQALDMAKRNGGNQLAFYNEIEEHKVMPGAGNALQENLLRQTLEWIQGGKTKKEVHRIMLGQIGRFYGAEEATLIRRTTSGNCYIECQWNAYKKGKTLEVKPENMRYFFEIPGDRGQERLVYIDGKHSPAYESVLKAFDIEKLDYPVIVMGECGKIGEDYVILVEKCESKIRNTLFQTLILEMMQWVDYLYSIQKEYEEAVQNDRNTGLPNYESFMNKIDNVNEDMISSFGMVGVQMVDLKRYNQQYGTIKGDESLAFAADRLASIFGKNNCYRVGRTSFFAICENMAYEQFVDSQRKIEHELEDKYRSWIVTSGAWEDTAISPKKMQEQIEEKLFIAKNKKKNSHAISEKTVMEIQEDISRLIQDGSFRVFLQPKADVDTGKICGAEALVRLHYKDKGIVPPGRFLPAIEQAGLIRYIDLFILESVCRIMKEWMEKGWQPFPISLNYSRITILEPDILYETDEIVERYGIDKSLIEIEITESIGSIDNASLKSIVNRFAESGYRIALDDYGAEYSNVYILYSLRLNTLKLDRRIINDVYHDIKARIIVENIIDLCKKFRIQCVAEGVETKEHLEVLKEMSCDVIQGYYLNKPLPEEAFYEDYIRR